MSAVIQPARSSGDIAAAARLFRDYAGGLGVDLCFQDFEAEVAGLPGAYAPPRGELLLAKDPDGRAVGCVALRPQSSDGVAEMKRLYVCPAGRGAGLGRRLVDAVLQTAAEFGYDEVRLDTLPGMKEAVGLYRSLRFEPIAPYYDTPVAGTLFLARRL
ncbi:MAG TPA: GNAT family N-acetyltransferase [Phenylobacterium sp.]|nr:GNAT family N-acetyltransferase [Phenylobacterium sp.]